MEGWGIASNSRSVQTESFCQNGHIQEVVDIETGCDSNQIQGLVFVTIEDTCIHTSLLPQHRKFLRFAFGFKAFQYSSSSFWPSTVTPHFYQCVDAILAPLRLQGSSVRVDGGSALRCHSRTHKRARVKVENQEECAFSSTENNFSWCCMGFNNNADTFVSCLCYLIPTAVNSVRLGQSLTVI
ncbi:Histidine biosynthesis bifunctional protein HisIE [Labeo rohita]|uniref:Histidine biosynthesis bifunctional protein HisIE n=1 Tax=Labeo rohita TaxID=84645 RepID=A0ABQ8MHG7_LABRO|nr:Histidine biosynthesis bifunctional protein HisIE [Labeo rohita]